MYVRTSEIPECAIALSKTEHWNVWKQMSDQLYYEFL
jgi:hypothetical protein